MVVEEGCCRGSLGRRGGGRSRWSTAGSGKCSLGSLWGGGTGGVFGALNCPTVDSSRDLMQCGQSDGSDQSTNFLLPNPRVLLVLSLFFLSRMFESTRGVGLIRGYYVTITSSLERNRKNHTVDQSVASDASLGNVATAQSSAQLTIGCRRKFVPQRWNVIGAAY